MIVWLASYPRSGNGYLRAAVYSFLGYRSVDSYEIGKPTQTPFPFAVRPERPLEELAADSELFFVKTHDLTVRGNEPAVYLVRDGRDSLVSYAWFTLFAEQGMDRSSANDLSYRRTLSNLIQEERSRFGTWSQNVDAWLRRPRTVVLKFEDFIHAPEKIVAACERLELELHSTAKKTMPSFKELQSIAPRYFRRGKVGSWRDEFPRDLLDLFWQLHGDAMGVLGYKEES